MDSSDGMEESTSHLVDKEDYEKRISELETKVTTNRQYSDQLSRSIDRLERYIFSSEEG